MTIILVVVAAAAIFGALLFNSLVARKNEVKNALATIDTMLKKRFDLIPNLVSTAKESMKFETDTLEKVIRLRATSVTTAKEAQQIDQQTASALKGFFAQVEAYPDLKSNQNLLQLQHSLQEVEDQLAASRRTYNAAVTNYNNALEMFPTNIAASLMAYRSADLFAATAEEQASVNVSSLFKA